MENLTFCPYAGNIFALKTVDIEIKWRAIYKIITLW
jgi:hypothetical protein